MRTSIVGKKERMNRPKRDDRFLQTIGQRAETRARNGQFGRMDDKGRWTMSAVIDIKDEQQRPRT
ncbi:MAG: hypothetical protein KAG89_09295, partial [Fulvimarina manganoxydans]|uniref:hypothetical protein n=1 Tax=Fulvimarina manganoxydans TaxID=937218 RepID=UPI002355A78D